MLGTAEPKCSCEKLMCPLKVDCRKNSFIHTRKERINSMRFGHHSNHYFLDRHMGRSFQINQQCVFEWFSNMLRNVVYVGGEI